jgi:hypothetical protein
MLFGGNGATLLGDTWEYNGVSWTQIATATAPSARFHHALAYDAARQRTVLFGGNTGTPQMFGDTWEYDGTNWVQRFPGTAPIAREASGMAYDVIRGRIVLFGGESRYGTLPTLSDTWEYDGSNWTQLVVSGNPLATYQTALVYDLARRRMLLFGGVNTPNTAVLLPAQAATWTRHGLGCAGSAGVPTLDPLPGPARARVLAPANATPALGSRFVLNLASLPATPGAAVLTFGFDLVRWNGLALPLPLDPFGLPGCRLWIGPAPGADVLLTHQGTTASFTLAIPANPLLTGLVVGTQAWVLDPLASSGNGSVTNGGILRLF